MSTMIRSSGAAVRLLAAAVLIALSAPVPASAHSRHTCEAHPPAVVSPLSPLAAWAGPERHLDDPGHHHDPGGSVLAGPSRIYIANDDHTDYMWSGNEAQYRAAFLNMLDYYMAQAETTAWRPSDQRSRFNTDGTLWVWVYETSRSAADYRRLIGHVRAGNLTVPLNLCVQLYGAMPAEAVIRSFSYAGRLERRENLRFPLVVPMENQTLPGGVASLFAGSGARYAWKGICDCSSRIDARNRPREIYWFTGPDGRAVLLKWNRFYSNSMGLGGYAEARYPATVVDFMSGNNAFLSRWPWTVAGAFGHGWDDLQSLTHQFVDVAVAKSNASRRVIVSNEVDFFQDFEATHGAALERHGACYGNEWDLYTASLGEVTARMKRATELLRTGEALAALVAPFDRALWPSLAAKRDSAMLAAGLYYEHSFGPGPGVTEAARNAWHRRLEAAYTAYAVALRDAAARAVGLRVAAPAGRERHLAFNPLSWERSDVVDLEVATPAPRHVVDVASGVELPSQTVTVDGRSLCRVLVSGVPAVGYRVVEVRPGPGSAAFPPAATVAGATLDNGLVTVTLGTRGQITSYVDRAFGTREWVAPGGALNDIGTGAGTGVVTVESSGPVSVTLRVAAGAPLARDTRVTLYAGSRRVDVRNEIRQNFGHDVGFTSRFDLPGMVMRHEEVGMIARVGRQSQGGDYANENTRTDGLTLNHFVDLSVADRGMTLSSWDNAFFRSGNSDPWNLDASTPTVRAITGFQPDGQGAGILNQGGDSYFLNRFAFLAHGAWDPAAAMRAAMEHQNPLTGIAARGRHRGLLPPARHSLLQLDSPEVLLWALKPAEEGPEHGLIARVWNLADGPRTATLGLAGGIHAAHEATHIETDLAPAALANGKLPLALARQQLQTYRLRTGPAPDPATEAGPARAEQESGGAADVALAAWPNPVRGGAPARLSFALARRGVVRLSLHDVSGARVATLVEGELAPGRHEYAWAGPGRRAAAPGLYFAKLETPDGVSTARIVRVE